jgi:hypothetical protein
LTNRKKGISAGLSAMLIASLMTFIAASTALAAITVGSAGNVPRAGTSTGTVSLTFTESAAACLANPLPASPDITVTIDQAGVTFSGTPVVSAPGSLGATASASGAVLTINLTGSDPLNVETLSITGLTLSATAAAPLGGVTATLGGDAATLLCFTGGTTTATGVVATGIAAGSTSVIINVDDCDFAVTDTLDLVPGTLSFGTSPETRNITAIAAGPGASQQTLTIQATANVHNLGETVSQSGVPACQAAVLTGLGTVVDSIIYNPSTATSVFPGEPNQIAGNLSITERTAGFISVGRTITFTIDTAGVVFSNTPNFFDNDATFAVSGGALSADRRSVSYTVTTASTAPVTFTLGDNPATLLVNESILYDVAASVPSGTNVTVTATVTGRVVVPTSRVNAIVGRIFTATSPAPNVNIGQNAQTAGLITIVEVTAGAFTDGSGAANVFEICLDGGATFTSPGPIATVVGGTAAGLLRLREGAVASPDNIVPGTPDPAAPGCYYWTVFTKSTTASTITIGSSATAGPLVNIPSGSTPGALNALLFSGTLDDPATVANERSMTQQVALAIAIKGFAGQVLVSAASQPIIAPGALHAPAGDIVVMETGNGQLKLGQTICVEIVPNQQTNILPDVFLSGLNTADLPVATGSNGIVVSTVTMSPGTCAGLVGVPGTLFESFRFTINQQSTTANGTVRISNIHYSAVNDAAVGPVQVNVWGLAVGGASIDFQRIISNARIGNPVAGTNATRLGVTQVGAFTTATKIQRTGRYVTYRIDFGVAAAGDAVQIWGATKTGNDWSAFTVVTTRIANASGVVYYYIRHNSATWRSYRGFWVDGGAWTPARQARWIP